MEQRNDSSIRDNDLVLLLLIHVARVVIYLGYTAILWFDFITWRPAPPFPGGPIVMQFKSLWPTIMMALVVILRSVITRGIWLRSSRTIDLSIVIDSIEILLVSLFLIDQIRYNYFITITLLFFVLLLLSISSLTLNVRIYFGDKMR